MIKVINERVELSRDQINQIVADEMSIDIAEAKKLVELVDFYGFLCFGNIYDLLRGGGEWAPDPYDGHLSQEAKDLIKEYTDELIRKSWDKNPSRVSKALIVVYQELRDSGFRYSNPDVEKYFYELLGQNSNDIEKVGK